MQDLEGDLFRQRVNRKANDVRQYAAQRTAAAARTGTAAGRSGIAVRRTVRQVLVADDVEGRRAVGKSLYAQDVRRIGLHRGRDVLGGGRAGRIRRIWPSAVLNSKSRSTAVAELRVASRKSASDLVVTSISSHVMPLNAGSPQVRLEPPVAVGSPAISVPVLFSRKTE